MKGTIMSDDIEIPEVDADDIIETSDEKTSVAGTVAIVTAGVAAGLGIGYGIMKISNKIGDKMYDHIVAHRKDDKNTEDPTQSNQEK